VSGATGAGSYWVSRHNPTLALNVQLFLIFFYRPGVCSYDNLYAGGSISALNVDSTVVWVHLV